MNVRPTLEGVTDRFSKSLELKYPPEDLWWAVEWWRSTIGDRFIAAGGEGRTTKITAFWEGGGYASRLSADELKEFAEAEHLKPNHMHCELRNASSLDHTLDVDLSARFWVPGELSITVNGGVKQQVFGLHAELVLEKEAEEARMAKDAERKALEAEAKKAALAEREKPVASDGKPPTRFAWGWIATIVGAVIAGGILKALGWV